MSVIKELRTMLYNHRKLISMIGEKSLPIKSILLKDVQDMNTILETAANKKEVKNGQSINNTNTSSK